MTTIGQAIGATCASGGGTYVIKVRPLDGGWEAYDAQATPSTASAAGAGAARVSSIPRVGGQFPGCPHCQAPSYFVCYSCNAVSCWDTKVSAVRCTGCGAHFSLGPARPVDLRSQPWQ